MVPLSLFTPPFYPFWPLWQIGYKTSSFLLATETTAKSVIPSVGCKIGLLCGDTGNHLSSVLGLGGVMVGKSLFIIKLKFKSLLFNQLISQANRAMSDRLVDDH